ncbi:aspartate-semialdehyde dehydrogenase [Candidatus Peregrinibacteria bacterium]|nr:aspartate-semialdehyde dehydrogenase [Candidatus Peregrinibacteria bacterium]
MKNVVVVGATGAVGVEMIRCLKELNFPVGKLHLTASERSVGKTMDTDFGQIEIEMLSEELLKNCDIALFSAGGDVSKEWRERVVSAGCLMIDNSSAFRYEADVPLVIPEINAEAAKNHKGVIANPNCTTAIAAVNVYPLYKEFGIRKMIVSTYQATSGAGAKGMDELVTQTKAVLEGGAAVPVVFAHQIAFNLIPHIDKFQENGYTKEEMKVAWETRKIFGDESLAISCTAVRIPTLRAHSESIVLETEKPVNVSRARELLASAPGVSLIDDPENLKYPMPINATGKFNVEIGRLRKNLVFGDHGLEFFVCGDQLLKGAALNAVQIAKLFI